MSYNKKNRKENYKHHLNNITRSNVTANKLFWKFIKLFLKNKSSAGNKDITLMEENKNKITTNKKDLRKEFNMDFMNIVEKVKVS